MSLSNLLPAAPSASNVLISLLIAAVVEKIEIKDAYRPRVKSFLLTLRRYSQRVKIVKKKYYGAKRIFLEKELV